MSRWFRWHQGTVEDGKFRVAARNAGVTVRDVIALWAFLLEDAASVTHNGSVTRKEDFMAAILEFESGVVERILAEMEDVGMISVGHGEIAICNWDKRQFKTDQNDPTNAKRQQRFRDRRKAQGKAPAKRQRNGRVTGRVTETKQQNNDQSTENRIQNTDTSLRSVSRKRGEPIRADWVPSERNRADARAKGLSETRIDAESERFRDHSLAKGVLHKNLDAAWRNWITSPYQQAKPNGQPRPGSKEDMRERTHNAVQKLTEYIEAASDVEDGSGKTSQENVGLLRFCKPP